MAKALPTPYYQSERVTLYCGDAREVLPTLADASVAATIADIPYGEVNRPSGGLRNLNKGNADVETFCSYWAAQEAARIGASVYLWCGMEQVSSIRRALVDAGMTTRLCVWEKSNPSPMNGDKFWLSALETCVFGRHPKAAWNGHCDSPCWRGPVEREQQHPTQKPLWLMRTAIAASTDPNDTVLDFCAGSGTTLEAALRLGRRAIGIEIDEGYCAIAKRRIQEAEQAFALFEPTVPEVQAQMFTEEQ